MNITPPSYVIGFLAVCLGFALNSILPDFHSKCVDCWVRGDELEAVNMSADDNAKLDGCKIIYIDAVATGHGNVVLTLVDGCTTDAFGNRSIGIMFQREKLRKLPK